MAMGKEKSGYFLNSGRMLAKERLSLVVACCVGRVRGQGDLYCDMLHLSLIYVANSFSIRFSRFSSKQIEKLWKSWCV